MPRYVIAYATTMLTLFILYVILTEPDLDKRRLSRIQSRIRFLRKVAEECHFEIIRAESEYKELVERTRL